MNNNNFDNILNIIDKNNNIKNLLKLYNDSNDIKKKKYKELLLKKVENLKKKEILYSTKQLSNLAKLNTTTDNVINIYKTLENTILTINNLSEYLNNNNTNIKLCTVNNQEQNNNKLNHKYIECYTN